MQAERLQRAEAEVTEKEEADEANTAEASSTNEATASSTEAQRDQQGNRGRMTYGADSLMSGAKSLVRAASASWQQLRTGESAIDAADESEQVFYFPQTLVATLADPNPDNRCRHQLARANVRTTLAQQAALLQRWASRRRLRAQRARASRRRW